MVLLWRCWNGMTPSLDQEPDDELWTSEKSGNDKRPKMAGDDALVHGFMYAKLPNGQRSKKRSLQAPWKVWRRHWCQLRKLGSSFGIELLLDHGLNGQQQQQQNQQQQQQQRPDAKETTNGQLGGSIRIPPDAIVCRTESRTQPYAFGVFPAKERKPLVYLAASSESESQRWMASIRQMLRPRRHRFMDGTFSVSMVDNAHSRSAGLTGLYGDMVASRSGVYVKDVHTGEIVETLEWKDTESIHLACAGREEDVRRICVIHTSKEFRGGVGELHVFCLEAPRLLLDLVRQGKGPRAQHRQLAQRPLSLSEGDLRLVAAQQQQQHRQHKQKRAQRAGHDDSVHQQLLGFQAIKHKIASNVVSIGLGMLLSSRSGSEAKLISDIGKDPVCTDILDKMTETTYKRAVDNVYHQNPRSNNVTSSLEELEEPSLRRISNISVGSGIYEEILDDFVPVNRTRRVPSNLYEDPGELILNSVVKLQPPPLPPRQRCGSGSTRNGSMSDDGLDSEGDTRSATPNTQEDATPTPPEDKGPVATDESHKQAGQIDTSEYVQMSPRPRDVAARELQQQVQLENMYMVMR